VVFSEPVTVHDDDRTLTGANYTFGPVSYNPATFTATWTLTAPIGIDRLTLRLEGVDVVRRFGVLPGDLDGNGLVTAVEATRVKSQVGKRYPTIKGADVDGVVTARDYVIVKLNVGRRLPS
jgi:hypothetical protein